MTDASAAQLNRVGALVKRFGAMRGRSAAEVTAALLDTKTLKRLGYRGDGHLTPTQAEAARQILETWIRRAGGGE